ncbi:S9 family peptidase [Thalassotalea psychrophila]|uniref:S9 family peptidase n=1 Tax=Thalassotalea psychrophila TaxID=3065647 RepID=A0ABY9TTZ6_9GAMM|nr:S9 family peptidase [Colwelliaceae bacterium SQ149]
MLKYFPLTFLFFIAFSNISIAKSTTEKLPLEYFFNRSDIVNLKISPTGEHFAGKVKIDGMFQLAILERKTMKPIQLLSFNKDKSELHEFGWLNNERVYASMSTQAGPLDKPRGTGVLFAGNIDGSKKIQLLGPNGNGFYFWGESTILSRLKDDDRNILIELSNRERSYVHKLNVYTGKIRKVAKSPKKRGSFMIDDNDRVRISVANVKEDDEHFRIIYYRDSDGDSWKEIDRRSEEQGSFWPLTTFDEKGLQVFASKGPQGKGIYYYNVKDKSMELVYLIEGEESIDGFLINEKNDLIGLLRQKGKLETELFDLKGEETTLYRSLAASFPEQVVRISSLTDDKRLAIVKTMSDRHPTTFYMYDFNKEQLSYLMSPRQWVDSKLTAPMEPIEFEARDGLKITGFLTRPLGKKKDLPMVVYVHGGPYGVKDEWRYDPRVQFMANRGYAVLQINYRGSGGRGREFERSAYRKMGAEMQDDLTDGTLWAIKQGVANKDRICIFGASYGGYASMMAVVKEPDLYQCAIPYVGIYDIALQTKYSDWVGVSELEKFMDEAWGAYDEEFVKERSPIYHLDKLKASLFLVHGEDDPRCPIEHHEALTDALDKRGIKYESMVKDHEGHGFYDLDNVFELHQRLEKFLKKHIGN